MDELHASAAQQLQRLFPNKQVPVPVMATRRSRPLTWRTTSKPTRGSPRGTLSTSAPPPPQVRLACPLAALGERERRRLLLP